jgi:methylmalonyl-CoA mutase
MDNPISNEHILEQWLQQVHKDLKGADFNEKLIHHTQGIDIQPLYTEADLPVFEADANADFMADMDDDFAEAVQDQQQQHVTWNITEEWEVSAETDLNALVKSARQRGVVDLRLRATQDSDWDTVFDGIRKMSSPANIHVDTNGLLDEHAAGHWRERIGFLGDRDRLIQSIQFDPILYWEKNGYPPSTATQFDRLAETFLRISGHLQDCRLVKIDTTDLAAAGATVVDQLAHTLHRAAMYFDALERRNITLFELTQLCTFRFGVDTNYFFEIAKLRAFRILWNNLVKAYDPELDFVAVPYVHAAITTRSFTTDDMHSNLLRSTTAAMSALLGAADAVSIPPFNTNNPDVQAVRLATNIQNLLRYESYMDRYRDAANGSYYIESLTRTIGEQAWEKFKAIHTF